MRMVHGAICPIRSSRRNWNFSQNLVRDLSSIATRCTVNGLNICGKKVCVFICLKKSDKPAAYILSVHPTGSGLSIESGVFRGENTDCMFDCPDILGGKAKIILI